jgi:hypothetical protein
MDGVGSRASGDEAFGNRWVVLGQARCVHSLAKRSPFSLRDPSSRATQAQVSLRGDQVPRLAGPRSDFPEPGSAASQLYSYAILNEICPAIAETPAKRPIRLDGFMQSLSDVGRQALGDRL